MTLLYWVAAWTCGIFLGRHTTSSPFYWLLAGILFASTAVVIRKHFNARIRLALAVLAFMAWGVGRISWANQPLPDHHIAYRVGTGFVTLSGTISDYPDVREHFVNLQISVTSLQTSGSATRSTGKILAQAPRYGNYKYGDTVTVTGKLLTPPEFDTFSYRDYLARRGIYGYIPNAEVDIIQRTDRVLGYVFDLRAHFESIIEDLLPSPQAPLLSGILLGVESQIPPDVREAFNRTGTSHIIAISGANIIVVIQVLLRSLQPITGKRRARLLTISGVGFYTILVGADPAVVRAAIMGSLSLIAMQTGRKAHGLTSLAFSIWLMSLVNPTILWDVGFQLSVAATAGLVLFADDFARALEAVLARGFAENSARQIAHWLSEPVTIGLAAQITTTPLILFYFGRFSLISFIANVLILPVQAYIMIWGWITVGIGSVWLLGGQVLAAVLWIPLTYTLEIVRSLSRLDWASTPWKPSESAVWIFYGVFLGIAWLRMLHPEDRRVWFDRLRRQISTGAAFVGITLVCVLVWYSALRQPDSQLHIWFLDVGGGNAVLLQTPQGAHVLIDGGSNPSRLRSAIGDILPFWDRNLELVLVSQPKSSAIGAVPALLENYRPSLILTNGQTAASESIQALLAMAGTHSWPVHTVTAGYTIRTSDGIEIMILYPPPLPPDQITNKTLDEMPLVIRVQYKNTSLLVVPEISEGVRDDLIHSPAYFESTIVVLPSHGHRRVNTIEFLHKVKPRVAIVMVAAGNRSDLPHTETLTRLASEGDPKVFRTDQHGTTEIITDGNQMWIYPETQ